EALWAPGFFISELIFQSFRRGDLVASGGGGGGSAVCEAHLHLRPGLRPGPGGLRGLFGFGVCSVSGFVRFRGLFGFGVCSVSGFVRFRGLFGFGVCSEPQNPKAPRKSLGHKRFRPTYPFPKASQPLANRWEVVT